MFFLLQNEILVFLSIANGAWLSPVERLLREQEAGGSNPLAPTTPSKGLR